MTVYDLDYARQLLANEAKSRKLHNTVDNIQGRIDAILNGERHRKVKVSTYKVAEPTKSATLSWHPSAFKSRPRIK
ncbi:MAG TPA: hypothetical protein VGD04_07265 [Methylophilus sp.]